MEPDLKPFELDSEVAASHLGQCAGTTWVLSKGFKKRPGTGHRHTWEAPGCPLPQHTKSVP